jgi:FkbM family methyltransferase
MKRLEFSSNDPSEKLRRTSYRGQTLYFPAKSMIGAFVAEGQGWDTVLVPIMQGLLAQHDPVVAEVGSNIGGSLLQMQLAKPKATFYCFEPSDRFLPILTKNVIANGWDNVTVESLIMGSKNEEKLLHSNASTASLVVKEYDDHEFMSSQTVHTTTLDDYFSGVAKPDFIKVDTDGFDYDVLLGADALLSREDRPIVFFEFERPLLERAGRRPEDLLGYLKQKGYTDFLVLSNLGEALAVTSSIETILALSDEQRYLDLVATTEQGSVLRSLKSEIKDSHVLRA